VKDVDIDCNDFVSDRLGIKTMHCSLIRFPSGNGMGSTLSSQSAQVGLKMRMLMAKTSAPGSTLTFMIICDRFTPPNVWERVESKAVLGSCVSCSSYDLLSHGGLKMAS
jgi:hypothetical protein